MIMRCIFFDIEYQTVTCIELERLTSNAGELGLIPGPAIKFLLSYIYYIWCNLPPLDFR